MADDVRIVVAQRGWVFVGYYGRDERDVVLKKAKSIRRWGTQHGLGELENGPKKDTVLDMAGTVRMHPLQVIATIDVNKETWKKYLDS